MDTPDEYIDKTKSAAVSLLTGIESYVNVLRSAPSPILMGDQVDEAARDVWLDANRASIGSSLEAQRRFVWESFAMANLSGALLQIAATGIRMYSCISQVPMECADLPLGNAHKAFCVGRSIRGVPLGLIVYAGRNQYNHLDDDELREPNVAIFNRLAVMRSPQSGEPYRDPAFDLSNPRRPLCLANNMTALIEWRDYVRYEADMKVLLGCDY
jgi:hypothetical protein